MTLPKTIAIGGGKGGAGRSTLAFLLAHQLTSRGHRVLLVDADTTCPTLHLWLGMADLVPPTGSGIGDPYEPLAPYIRDATTTGLALLSFAHARGYPYVRPRLSAPSLLERFEELSFDTVIIDLPSGHDPVSVSLLALARFPILVANPDMAGLAAATQHMRAAMFHGLGFHPDCYDAEEELLMLLRDQGLHMDRGSLDRPYLSDLGRRIVLETRTTLSPNLLLNKVRTQTGAAALAATLAMGWNRLMGVFPRPLGQIPWDDAFTPPGSGVDPPPGKVEAAIVDIARTLEDAGGFTARHPRPLPSPRSPQGVLGVSNTVAPTLVSSRLEGARGLLKNPPPSFRPIFDERSTEGLLHDVETALRELDPPDSGLPELRPAPAQLQTPAPLQTPTPAPTPPPIPARAIIEAPTPEPEPAPAPTPEPVLWPEPEAVRQELELFADIEAEIPSIARLDVPLNDDDDGGTPEPEPALLEPLARSGNEPSADVLRALQDLDGDLSPQRHNLDPSPEPFSDTVPAREIDAPTPDPAPDQAAPKPTPDPAAPNTAPATATADPTPADTTPTPEAEPPRADPPGDSPGTFLKDVRRNNNMSLRELSLRTKIGVKYLNAIEKVDRKILPRPVYLRGYLREISQVFKLDEAELIERYFTWLGYP